MPTPGPRSLPRVLVLAGTRPEAIKLAPVVRELRDEAAVRTWFVSTGQHRDLLDHTLTPFGLAFDRDLRLMRKGQNLFHIGRQCLAGLEGVMATVRPDLVVVQGDTATVLFGALSAYFQKVELAHVEAGLRTGDKWRPYPEEMFRRLTTVLADLHFAPTWGAYDRLVAEGVPEEWIHVTGNTAVDAVQMVADSAVGGPSEMVRRLVGEGRRIVLVTAHRRESFGRPLQRIFDAVRALADRHDDVVFVVPLHPNPAVRDAATSLHGHPRIRVTRPLPYVDLLSLLQHATLALTDSGGVQEEAPSFRVPVLVLRDVTERPEGIGNVARLVGTDFDRIVGLAGRLLSNEAARRQMTQHPNPYGDGRASARIADIVVHRLTGRPRHTIDWEGLEPASELAHSTSRAPVPAE
jgi:UDP-N-acetylglucosamine 2-epimerase (non-hydrolysing)